MSICWSFYRENACSLIVINVSKLSLMHQNHIQIKKQSFDLKIKKKKNSVSAALEVTQLDSQLTGLHCPVPLLLLSHFRQCAISTFLEAYWPTSSHT